MLTRKDFMKGGLAATATLAFVGCGDDEGDGGSTGGTSAGGNSTGGSDTGGNSTGGTNSGGMNTGGNNTGGMNTGGGGGGGGDCNSVAADITSAHPHDLTVPAADVLEGTEKTYTISGGHTHEFVVTAQDFADLAAGMSVTITSEMGAGHTHSVELTCG